MLFSHDKIDRYDINITNFDGEHASLPHFVQNCDVKISPDLIGLYFAVDDRYTGERLTSFIVEGEYMCCVSQS